MMLLDLFCGAGGASVGYHRAGFDVVGVDLEPQPDYPFPFIQGDALEPPFRLDAFDVVHASPPCQRYSQSTPKYARDGHPDLVGPVREMLAGHRYIIENVPAPPIDGHALLCGSMFGLGTSTGLQLRRHRLFELWPGAPLIFTPPHGHDGYAITVVGNGTPTGNRKTLGRDTTQVERGEAMGIDWCNRQGVTQAVPPAYTEHIGRAILAAL